MYFVGVDLIGWEGFVFLWEHTSLDGRGMYCVGACVPDWMGALHILWGLGEARTETVQV